MGGIAGQWCQLKIFEALSKALTGAKRPWGVSPQTPRWGRDAAPRPPTYKSRIPGDHKLNGSRSMRLDTQPNCLS
ncbi:MAG: hypothetical protein D6728_05580 [Cyanobacteria bacterium J055]|nr:MAG: hypothetical protein D6728_05580 [Cyanobacteria bacterium J055]